MHPRNLKLSVGAGTSASLLALTAAGLAFRRDMAQARQRLSDRSSIADSPYGAIEYAVAGSGPPILAIHGAGGGFDQGLELTETLVEGGFKVIAPSRFGYLRSARPADSSPELQADAFAWLLSHLGIEHAAILGASAGALSALSFALHHGDRTRALLLMVPAAYAPDRTPGESAFTGLVGEAAMQRLLGSDLLFWAALKLMPQQMMRWVLATPPSIIAAAGDEQRALRILGHILPVSERSEGLMDDWCWASAPPEYPLSRITAPVLTLSMEDDLYGTYAAARHIASQVRDGHFAGYPTGGHIGAGRIDEIAERIVSFLASQD